VRVDRADAQHQLLGDLAVRAAGGDQPGDLPLARGQRPGGRFPRRPQHAVAEPAQLARGLVARSQGSEAVERRLRLPQRLDGRSALARGAQRPALREPGAGPEERRVGRGRACGRRGDHGLRRAPACQQQGRTRDTDDGRRPGRAGTSGLAASQRLLGSS
jgi:hypothetical protein